MRPALFDLDHTLLDGDTDQLWGRFPVDEGRHDEAEWSRECARHVADCDLPLLVAVDPEPRRRARAESAGWPVISRRQAAPA